jgi:hypothetical protein
MMIRDLEERARFYAQRRGYSIEKPLGHGSDGAVWQSSRTTAIKVCEDQARYCRERDCYRLFEEQQITEVYGFAIPRLVQFDDGVQIIEMDIVHAPYIIDFGKGYLHRRPPEFSAETMADWLAEKEELYGKHSPTIQAVLRRLVALGVYHMAPKPANILPADWTLTWTSAANIAVRFGCVFPAELQLLPARGSVGQPHMLP